MSAKIGASKNKDSGEIIKNYHKQAFEYISKALRIDEDETGLFQAVRSDRGAVTACDQPLPPPLVDRREGAGCAMVQERDRRARERHCGGAHGTR